MNDSDANRVISRVIYNTPAQFVTSRGNILISKVHELSANAEKNSSTMCNKMVSCEY